MWRRLSIVGILTALAGLGAAGPGSAAAPALTATVLPQADCTIYGGDPPSTGDCGGTSADTVGRDGDGFAYRTLVSFAPGLGLPPGARVLSATLQVTVGGVVGAPATALYPLWRAFRPGQTSWQSYDNVHGWEHPGGDLFGPAQASAAVAGPGPASFSITRMAAGWLDGSFPIPALALTPLSPAGSAFAFAPHRTAFGPVLAVSYRPPPVYPSVQTRPVRTVTAVPATPSTVRARLALSWSWRLRTTFLRSAGISGLPPRALVAVTCRGSGCPYRARSAPLGPARTKALLASLTGSRYRAGDQLTISVSAPGLRTERALATIRDGTVPVLRLAL